MASRIGSDLHRARTRREIELSEVEAATRIRARFLSAIENEEWDALPGGVYTRGFIRTYASYLGLDGNRIAEDYRREFESGSVERPEAAASPAPMEVPRRRRMRPGATWLALATVALLTAVAIFAIPNGGEEAATPAPRPHPPHEGASSPTPNATSQETAVSMQLVADAEVWVCALDHRGEPLVDGQILAPGAEAGPFRSGSFTLSFGNGEVTMTIDGKQAEIPPTASPVGYAVGADGALRQLSEAERPTCE